MRIHPRKLPVALLLAGLVLASWAQAQPALEELLSRIPARETSDRNRYSMTDVQYALRARLDWNALLQRSRIVHEESGLSFTLVVGSSIGSCASKLVEWPEPPTMRGGEIFVSEGLLKVVFENFPDFKLEGQAEEPLEMPPVSDLDEMALEEPPQLYSEESPKALKNIVAVFLSGDPQVGEGTETANSPAKQLMDKVTAGVTGEGVSLETKLLALGNADSLGQSGDAMIAVRIESASPTPSSAFLYYEYQSLPSQSRGNALVEWDRVPAQVRGASRSMAETFNREFAEVFGSSRTYGVRGAPIELLQGLRVPSIQINLGVPSGGGLGADLEKMVEVFKRSLTQLKSEG